MNNLHQNARLTVRSRKQIVVRFMAGQSAPEVAAAFAVSIRTMRKRLARFGARGRAALSNRASTPNGLFKAEVIHRRGPWRSFEAVEYATLEWVDWFNNRRLLEPIGNIPPAEAEARFYAMLDTPAMAA